MSRWTVAAITLIGIASGQPRAAAAQDSLAAAKDPYAAAAYEDALKVLGRLESPERKSENAQYQVFCLIALDRLTEAEDVIARILEAEPLFAPDREEASPRVQELFDRVRTRIAPRLARELYADAKATFERKDHEAARAKFEMLLQIVERAEAGEDTLLAELKLLARGFLDLARAAATAPAPSASPPTAAAGPAAGVTGDGPSAFTPAVPIVEVFPPWNPSGFGGTRLEFKGILRLKISAAGRVEASAIVESIHPTYDRRLLDAAAHWTYEPARRGSTPVESVRVVVVRLKQQ